MKQFCYTGVLMILMICTHESRGSVVKPLPSFLTRPQFNWHVLNTDTIPAQKPADAQKKEEPAKQEGEAKAPVQPVKELPKTKSKAGEVVKKIKEVPKSKKQPKPVAVKAPKLPVKVPVIKTPKVIRKIKL
ncbi:hypothetical protein [Pseudoflavitalea rhizosphaerae]|uniref:hypothetical protein n=1 Tax=Pseudoflavitalea rhizosphaerae TaxID=1884793 RepID=UPI000F8D59AB|nr:hypothetical protein [Pseudoflavitalea rhizosphaerae]